MSGRSKNKGMNKVKTISLLAILGVSAVLVFWGLSYVPGVPWSVVDLPGQDTDFAITVTDGKTLDSLQVDDFDYVLYGTDDLSEWLDFEVIETGSGLGRIADSDLDLADYAYFVVKYNGTVAEEDFDDSLGDRTYAARWAPLAKGVLNQLVTYQQPSSVGRVALNLETRAYLDIAGSALTGAVNCTWVLGSNGSQPDAAWVLGWNYEVNAWDKVRLVVTYNATVTSDIAMSVQGTSRVRISGTVYSYEFNELGASTLSLNGIWGESATKFYKVSTAALYYGETAL